ncbi:MAG: hypothetical protein JO321_02645 [Solirubrobacterales bacterium]|nr:hypothetical protein [Solirubrobacterales bacterium]
MTVAKRIHVSCTASSDYVGATPVLAILPCFFADAIFPISALPGGLAAVA